MNLQRWLCDIHRTAFSLHAGVRIEARERKGLESQGQGVARSGAPSVQPLPSHRGQGQLRPVRPLPSLGPPKRRSCDGRLEPLRFPSSATPSDAHAGRLAPWVARRVGHGLICPRACIMVRRWSRRGKGSMERLTIHKAHSPRSSDSVQNRSLFAILPTADRILFVRRQ